MLIRQLFHTILVFTQKYDCVHIKLSIVFYTYVYINGELTENCLLGNGN